MPKEFAESTATNALKATVDSMKTVMNNTTDPADKARILAWISESEDLLGQNVGDVSYADIRNQLRMVPCTTSTDTMPSMYSEGGKSVMPELTEKDVRELRIMFGVDDDGKIVESAKLKFGELKELQDKVAAQDQERKFAEEYPQFWDEHNRLMERDRVNTAKNFAESVTRVRRAEGFGLRDTPQCLSAKALEQVQDVHKKFAEGTATLEDFETVVKTITNGGIVTVGEIGHSNGDSDSPLPEFDTSSATGVAASKKVFGEVMQRIQNEHPDWSFEKCLNEAATKHPDLAEAYRVTLPA